MDEIVIEIVDTHLLKLCLKDRNALFMGADHGHRHLGGNGEAVAGITANDNLADRGLAHEIMVHPSGIAVGKASTEEGVHHLFHLGNVDTLLIVGVGQGHSHKAKSELVHVQASFFD